MRPLRNPAVQATLAWLFAGWMRFCFATIRWTRENQHLAEDVWAKGGGVIPVFWHSRIALSTAAWPQDRATPTKALVSLSPDGQFLARALDRMGFPAIRGSTEKPGKPGAAKGGSAAFREVLRQLRVGGCAVTPDGPRGPANQMGEGVPLMAKLSGAPVLMMGLSCSPSIRLNSWDRALVPLPFGRGAIVWDLVRFPEGGDPVEVARDWTTRLSAVEARADALAAGER
jgi:lysophospholipid acyltransferase (LPLAT)-like uncharacterized protein